jgi:hypothetical protein
MLATAADPIPAFDSTKTEASVVVVVILATGRRAKRLASPPEAGASVGACVGSTL